MAEAPLLVYAPAMMARRRKPNNQSTPQPGTLAHLVQSAREAKGWSQADVAYRARELGATLDASDVSDVERGATAEPRYSRMRGLSRALDIPIGDLYGAVDTEPADWSSPVSDVVDVIVKMSLYDVPLFRELEEMVAEARDRLAELEAQEQDNRDRAS